MTAKARLKNLISVSLLIIIALSCGPKPKSTVEVIFENLEGKTRVSLFVQEFKANRLVSTMEVTPKKPKAHFKLLEGGEPLIVQIVTEGKNRSETLAIVEEGQNVRLFIDLNMPSNYTVVGSEESILVKNLNDKLLFTRRNLDSLKNLLSVATERATIEKLRLQSQTTIDSQRVFSSRFIWEHPMARASVVALYQQLGPNVYVFDRAEDLQLFRVVASSLIARFPESNYAKGMVDDINEMTRRLKSHQVLNLIKESKPTLPDIVMPNTKGDTVRLSSNIGKVIILNFWASWNANSMVSNQELAKLSNEFKGKPLVIFNVSMDSNREVWVKAIEQANFPGIHVSDLNPSGSVAASIYNVTNLPTNFVIDKNYDIIGRNVYGESLVRMVSELLK